MSVTTYWAPNQAAIAQVRSYAFSAPNAVGNTYNAAINGKTVTYSSVSGDTATTVATALFSLLNQSTGIAPELTEITFANPSAGVMTATAKEPGTPFAGVTVNGVANQGLVLSTGNGLANGITTTETTANASPSDVNDAQNWLRVNLSSTPPSNTRSLPQNTDDVVVADSSVPMLWNLDRLSAIQFNTYTRRQSMTGQIGLEDNNAGGYQEWRARYFRFNGPQGSVPSGGLAMVIGSGSNGSGSTFERYDLQSSQYTLTVLAGTRVDILGQHTANTFTLLGGVTLNVASGVGEKANLTTSTVDGGSTLNIGQNVTWTAASTLNINGGSAILNAAPATLALSNGAQVVFAGDGLTWATITAQGGCLLTWLCGGIITTLTMTTGCTLDKSGDLRGLTITNSTIDGDTCQFLDPLNVITWTNATSVKQAVNSGPFQFTGTRTVKVT